jgi:hypothetical protein
MVLRVVGAGVRRIERQELAKFVLAEDVVLGAALAQIGVADPQLGVRSERAAGIVVDDLTVVLTRARPLLLHHRFAGAIHEIAVGLRVRGDDVLLAAAARRRP